MKSDLKVVKKDSYNIDHLFQKKTLGQKITSSVKNVFTRKSSNRRASTGLSSDFYYWGRNAALFSLGLFFLSMPIVPHLFWVAVQIVGSFCGFILLSKIYQHYQYQQSMGYTRKFDSYNVSLGILAAIFFLLPYINGFH